MWNIAFAGIFVGCCLGVVGCCCVVLCYVVLCCVVLCCAVLCCIVPGPNPQRCWGVSTPLSYVSCNDSNSGNATFMGRDDGGGKGVVGV